MKKHNDMFFEGQSGFSGMHFVNDGCPALRYEKALDDHAHELHMLLEAYGDKSIFDDQADVDDPRREDQEQMFADVQEKHVIVLQELMEAAENIGGRIGSNVMLWYQNLKIEEGRVRGHSHLCVLRWKMKASLHSAMSASHKAETITPMLKDAIDALQRETKRHKVGLLFMFRSKLESLRNVSIETTLGILMRWRCKCVQDLNTRGASKMANAEATKLATTRCLKLSLLYMISFHRKSDQAVKLLGLIRWWRENWLRTEVTKREIQFISPPTSPKFSAEKESTAMVAHLLWEAEGKHARQESTMFDLEQSLYDATLKLQKALEENAQLESSVQQYSASVDASNQALEAERVKMAKLSIAINEGVSRQAGTCSMIYYNLKLGIHFEPLTVTSDLLIDDHRSQQT